jgi:NAD(P)-dependent dehydrogenase (short-subunit alcohol dehydrogenase family)
VGAQGFSAYCASKGALIHLTQTLALELAPIGIAVNAIAPGATGTEPVLAFYKASPHVREKRLRDIPAGRLATPEEMAEAALFLTSDESGYIHGHNLVVDGGYLIH